MLILTLPVMCYSHCFKEAAVAFKQFVKMEGI